MSSEKEKVIDDTDYQYEQYLKRQRKALAVKEMELLRSEEQERKINDYRSVSITPISYAHNWDKWSNEPKNMSRE